MSSPGSPSDDPHDIGAPRRRPYYGWTILGVAILAIFVSSPGQTYVIAVFVNPIEAETGWTRTFISGLYTMGSLTAAAGMLLIGRLMDRFGARVTLTAVGLVFGLAALWMSRVTQPIEMYVGFALLRLLGQGALTVVPTTMVALWFVRLRGRAMALTSLGAVAGQASFPPLVHLLIVRSDWRTAWVVLAVVIWALLLPAALLLVRRSPESVGLLPDGDDPRRTSPPDQHAPPSRREDDWTLAEALRTRSFWLLLVATSPHSLISTALTFHHVAFMASLGVDSSIAAAVLAVLAPFAIAGTLLAGVLADRLPARYLLAANQGGLAATMIWSFFIGTAGPALVYGALLGATSGFSFTLQSTIWPTYYGRHHLASIRSVAATTTIAAAAIGPLPFGWLFDLTGSFRVPLLVFLILPAISGLAAMLATRPRKGNEGSSA
ncbi:MAG TPA: MFS transporter [Candidatus Binatia bacterium]|nr:MFS transporter [Candidatus Binatia bacterium]